MSPAANQRRRSRVVNVSGVKRVLNQSGDDGEHGGVSGRARGVPGKTINRCVR